jgi:endonuclease/exonuclease/phosphatase family metal-dependent hydrolase
MTIKHVFNSSDGRWTSALLALFLGWVTLLLVILTAPLLGWVDHAVGLQPGDPQNLADDQPWETRPAGTIRVATFNVALERREAGLLHWELRSGESEQAKKLAEIIQRVRPDILLLNEVDRDAQGENLELFHSRYLQASQNGQQPILYEHRLFPNTNTGVDSGVDLNGNGQIGEADDAFGFGRFPGQYGMAILSRFPIKIDEVRTFHKFLWQDLPNAKWPKLASGEHYYSDNAREIFRLSSKNHVAVPIDTPCGLLHLVVAHPTPPVFDGPEDRNGLRNHDEIRLLADLVSPDRGSYLVDDQGRRGSLPENAKFIIAGDLNADPVDGDSTDRCILQLLEHPLVHRVAAPTSKGGLSFAALQGKKNLEHRGDPAHDTSDFNDETTGNLRVDYVLPSITLELRGTGVFWPEPEHPAAAVTNASDHRLVWIDVR